MGLRISQNIAAMNAYRNLSVTDGQMAKSLEKLSSGFRINRAADDAAGLSISEGVRAQVGGLKVAAENLSTSRTVCGTTWMCGRLRWGLGGGGYGGWWSDRRRRRFRPVRTSSRGRRPCTRLRCGDRGGCW